MEDYSFIPECYVDTNLIETLLPPQKRYNHQKGCGTVVKIMKEKFNDKFAVGFIDKDKHEVNYLKEFSTLVDLNSLLLHKHPFKPHYIIQVNPAMEKFITENAALANIKMEDFGLPSNIDILKREAKRVVTKDDQRFKKLFKSIYNAGVRDFVILKQWLRHLKDNNYRADITALQQIANSN